MEVPNWTLGQARRVYRASETAERGRSHGRNIFKAGV